MNLRLLVLFVSVFVCKTFVSAQINLTNDKMTLVADGGDVYGNGRFLSKSEVRLILNDKPDQLEFYTKGKRFRSTGTGLLVGGVFATIAGFGIIVSSNDDNTSTEPSSAYYTGVLIEVVGEAMIAGGIVCRIVGKNKIKRAVSDYNLSSYRPQPAKYNLTLGLNSKGLVLALKF